MGVNLKKNSALFQPHYSKNKEGIIIAPPFTNLLPASARIFGCYCLNSFQFPLITDYQPHF